MAQLMCVGVRSWHQMCCCTAGGRDTRVSGFCVAAGDGSRALRIALRLRSPRTHKLQRFETVMRVLLHEMAHIVHSNHSAHFYELMEELGRQYDGYLARGVVLDAQNMPMAEGNRLDPKTHNPRLPAKRAALAAAEARQRKARVLGRGGAVGGFGADGDNVGGCRNGAEWRSRDPRELAVRAAQARQRQWDAEHGLGADELALSASAARAEEQEAEEASVAATQRGAASSSAPAAATGTVWAARGQGTWRSAARCPVCGPVCDAQRHGRREPPAQDADEGGATALSPTGATVLSSTDAETCTQSKERDATADLALPSASVQSPCASIQLPRVAATSAPSTDAGAARDSAVRAASAAAGASSSADMRSLVPKSDAVAPNAAASLHAAQTGGSVHNTHATMAPNRERQGARRVQQRSLAASQQQQAPHAVLVVDLTTDEASMAALDSAARAAPSPLLSSKAPCESALPLAERRAHKGAYAAAGEPWACPFCTFVNSGGSTRCEMLCGATRIASRPGEAAYSAQEPGVMIRPHGGPPQSGWTCTACTLLNAKSHSHCDACGQWRFAR